jgi:quercetin dioxygenase-like cupin family protein
MADSSHASTVISDLPPPMDGRKEFIGRTASPETVEWFPGLRGHLFAGASRGAKNLTTLIGSLEIRAQTQFHRHPCSEVVTPLDGDVVALVDNRRYDLRPLETIHIPAGIGHAIFAPGNGKKVTIHVALADADPKTEFLPRRFGFSNRGLEPVRNGDPEYIARREIVESYSLGDGAVFKDLSAGRFGTKGICGGYAEFNPGGSPPCHIHK